MVYKLPFVLFLLSVIQVTAFPRLTANSIENYTKLTKKSGECPHLAQQKETECPHLAKKQDLKRQITFDPATQQVSTTGQYAWVAPGTGDQRGVCTFPHLSFSFCTKLLPARHRSRAKTGSYSQHLFHHSKFRPSLRNADLELCVALPRSQCVGKSWIPSAQRCC